MNLKKPNVFTDSLLVVVLVLLLIGILKFNPVNFNVFNLKEAWRDFELTDLYFSKIKAHHVQDTAVAIVDIDTLGRGSIAKVIQQLNESGAAVIAVDAYFSEPGSRDDDSALWAAFANAHDKLILAGYYVEAEDRTAVWHTSHERFGLHTTGHINLVGDNEKGTTIRYFRPALFGQHALSVEAVQKYDEQKADAALKRGKEYELINYIGGIDQFTHISGMELLKDPSLGELLKGKIVLLGYAGRIGEKNSLEDAHFTPMNTAIGGRSLPDTYGVVIHANIISMMLRGDYLNKVSTPVNFLVAFVVGLLHVLAYVYFFVQRHKWFHLVAKISQLVTSILLMFVTVMLMGWGLKFEPTLTLVLILLSVDVLYFYEPAASYLTRKLGYESYFSSHHHH